MHEQFDDSAPEHETEVGDGRVEGNGEGPVVNVGVVLDSYLQRGGCQGDAHHAHCEGDQHLQVDVLHEDYEQEGDEAQETAQAQAQADAVPIGEGT